jgi:hypothetical protein
MSGHIPPEYLDLIERVNQEIKDKEPKNYWKQIRRLCMERMYMKQMTKLSEEFKERISLNEVRRTNKPFYFYNKEDLDKVETLVENVTSPKNVNFAIETLQGYEQILTEYKKANR